MDFRRQSLNYLLAFLLVALCSGCGGGASGTENVGSADSQQFGSLSLRMDVSAIPRLNQTTGGTPDTIQVDILNPGSRAEVHPRSTFTFDRQQSFQTFFINSVVPGTHIVRIEIYDSTGAQFFAGEQQVVLNPGAPTAVRFVITPGDDPIDPGDATPSPTFRCVQNADDEQGQPDVDVTDDGYFFVVARVTDATVEQPGQSFDTYGFIHGERFQTSFDGSLPTSIDAGNGNDGDFDISQFNTLESIDGPSFFDQQAVHPRISINDSQAAVIAWLDSNPSPSAGGVMNGGRNSIVRSVILGPDSNTSPNSSGFVEAEFFTPVNAEPNIAGPTFSGLTRPSVSMTNLLAGDATIDYAFFNPTAEAHRYNDGGASSALSANGDPPVPSAMSTLTANFGTSANLAVTNRRNNDDNVVVVGANASPPDQVVAQLTSPSVITPTTLVVNLGQPSETLGSLVLHVEADWFESGTVVFVYTVLESDGLGAGLYARCFDANLVTPVGDEIAIAPLTIGQYHNFADVSAVDTDGTFLVTWTETTTSGSRVLLQRFSCTDGSRTPSNPIDVAAGQEPLAITNQNRFSRVAATTDGHAVVAWQTGEAEIGVVNVKALARIFPESSTD